MSLSLAYSSFDSTLVLQFSATAPLPRPLLGYTSTQGRSHTNSRSLPTTRSSANPPTTLAARIPHPSSWWPGRGGHAQPRIVNVSHAQAKERNAAAGAPKKDEDIVPDEYLDPPSPNSDSQQQTTAVQPATGEHGGDRSYVGTRHIQYHTLTYVFFLIMYEDVLD
ncbi:hypothetical protein EDD22DRAFT_851845 [Suillus occidentalis]|nr:hypothetical protein EDD22DRAFT_851845 [Suillus occidentalis]